MKAKIKYEKKIANKFYDTKYHESNEFTIKNQELLDKEKERLSTKKDVKVSNMKNEINAKAKRQSEQLEENTEEKTFIILKKIYYKNREIALGRTVEKKNAHLLNLVADIPLLINSYAKVRKNKGYTSLASFKSDEKYSKLDQEQLNLINKTDQSVDGISLETFQLTRKLIKAGKYPWGASKKIYFNKPGKPGTKRPITIPLFMDRVIQEVIKCVLVAIYEPYFDKMNCSFGFRPNRSVHDAIHSLTNKYTTQGLDIALEGDIRSAYDKVNRNKLIEILGKKITDKKFLSLIKDRLNYEYYDSEKDIFIIDEEGIPQCGTDSPYLWNIYMLEFDIYITNILDKLLEKTNIKTRGKNSDEKKFTNKERVNFTNRKLTLSKILTWIHQNIKQKGNFKEDLIKLYNTPIQKWKDISPIFPAKLNGAKGILSECKLEISSELEIRHSLQRQIKRIIHRMNSTPFLDENKKRLKYIYCRYADDWIILSNLKGHTLIQIKEKAKNYLNHKLYATLSEEKTLVTKIKDNPAHFLGFEIKAYRSIKIAKELNVAYGKRKMITQKLAGKRVFALVDKQRLINRLHMKDYCDKNGFPREITKLNNLEIFSIIEKINSVMLGLVNYYINYIRSPRSELSRWIYIIQYACFKTIALKHKLTVKKVLKKFKPKEKFKGRTIEDTVSIKINDETYQKSWRLYNLHDLMNLCRTKAAQLRKAEIEKRYLDIRKELLPDYKEKSKGINVSNEDYLERSNWTNIRTTASFKLPCCICGSENNIEMHHVKYVRKVKYTDINKEKTWEQIMGLRNRKQIPVCRECHQNIIRAGKYGGRPLNTMSIDKMFDNRLVNIESYVHKGKKDVNYKKFLTEKGWKHIPKTQEANDNITSNYK